MTGATVNGNGSLTFRAERVGSETLLSQIVHMVAQAQRTRAPIQRLADIVSAYFVLAVLVVAALTFVAYSVPAFWLGLMMIILFSVKLGWLPTSGIVNPDLTPGTWEATVDWMKHLILPVSVLAISEIIQVQRFMRSSLLEVLRQDYLTTARAKGLSEGVVIGRHALKNAAVPIWSSAAYPCRPTTVPVNTDRPTITPIVPPMTASAPEPSGRPAARSSRPTSSSTTTS